MSVGDNAIPVLTSYVAVGKETTWGVYNSATTAIEFLACSFRTDRDSQKLDSIGLNRGFTKRVQLNKNVAGNLEMNLHTVESTLLMAAALGGGIVSSSVSSGVYVHSLTAGNLNTSPSSVSFNVRKGDSHVFRYMGGRINTMKIGAAVGEVAKITFEMIFKDSTLLSDDISTALSITSTLPMTFVDGKFRYADSEANANTTTAEEQIQSFELTVNNNLVNDAKARALGTDVLMVLPGTRRDVQLTVTQRFDTTTAYARFSQATQGSVELFFRGGQSLSSSHFPEIVIRMPKVFQNSPDPTLDGPGEILQSTFTYDVLVDNPGTTTGKDIGITVRNQVAAY